MNHSESAPSVGHKRPVVGILTKHDLRSRNDWSGIPFYMARALQRQDLDLVMLGQPPEPVSRWPWARRHMMQVGSPAFQRRAARFAARVRRDLSQQPCDVVLAIVSCAELSLLTELPPFIYTTDSTWQSLSSLYPHSLTAAQSQARSDQEAAVMRRAWRLAYPSHWAAESAISDYGCPPEQVVVIPYGANVDSVPSQDEVLQHRRDMQRCRLLFIGKEWERKGGSIACDTVEQLRQLGCDAELVIIGCRPPISVGNAVQVIPYLDKNQPADAKRFQELLWNSHFLLFPTRAECYGIVTCEANAYGLPVVSTQVGGVTTTIRHGHNGFTLPVTATGRDFAQQIQQTFSNSDDYIAMSRSARQEYDDRLNWDAWARSIRDLAFEIAEA